MRNVNTASMLDNDLYKFSMSYAYMKLFPEAEGTFEFCDRNKTVYTSEFVQVLSSELHKLAERMLLSTERSWCVKHIQYICIFTFRNAAASENLVKIKVGFIKNSVFEACVA